MRLGMINIHGSLQNWITVKITRRVSLSTEVSELLHQRRGGRSTFYSRLVSWRIPMPASMKCVHIASKVTLESQLTRLLYGRIPFRQFVPS
jgi:hypothetical protein